MLSFECVLREILVRVESSAQLVLCAVCSHDPRQFAPSMIASLGRAYACMHMVEAGQNQSRRADSSGWTFVKARNDIPPYIHTIARRLSKALDTYA